MKPAWPLKLKRTHRAERPSLPAQVPAPPRAEAPRDEAVAAEGAEVEGEDAEHPAADDHRRARLTNLWLTANSPNRKERNLPCASERARRKSSRAPGPNHMKRHRRKSARIPRSALRNQLQSRTRLTM